MIFAFVKPQPWGKKVRQLGSRMMVFMILATSTGSLSWPHLLSFSPLPPRPFQMRTGWEPEQFKFKMLSLNGSAHTTCAIKKKAQRSMDDDLEVFSIFMFNSNNVKQDILTFLGNRTKEMVT